MKLLDSMGNVLGSNITSSTCLATRDQILEQKGVTDISKWNCLWITFGFVFVFKILFISPTRLGTRIREANLCGNDAAITLMDFR